MGKAWRRWLLPVLIAGVIIAVMLWITGQKTRGSLVASVLTGQPCAPPCWQGFVPGTVMERKAVTRQIRRLRNTKYVTEDGYAIDWIWRNQPGVNNVFIDRDGVIRSISMFVDFALPVEDIIQKYGPPEAVNWAPFGYGQNYYLMLVLYYPQHGMVCRVRVYPDYAPILQPQDLVYEINYIIPANSVEEWFGDNIARMNLHPWPDYGRLMLDQ